MLIVRDSYRDLYPNSNAPRMDHIHRHYAQLGVTVLWGDDPEGYANREHTWTYR